MSSAAAFPATPPPARRGRPRKTEGERDEGNRRQALIAEAARRGLNEVALNAQTHALDFYLRHGFEPVGEVFMEAGIPHRAMRRPV